MSTETITCIGYLRVSTERQADEVHSSLADQEAAVRSLAERLGTRIGRLFTDAGASGATVEGRAEFLAMLEFCQANRRGAKAPGLVLVLNDSRFGRFPDPEEAAYWRHHLRRLGWLVRFAEGDDVQGDMRTVVRAIGSVQATEYRRNLIANTRRGMAGAATQGFWTREAPFGYRRMVVYPDGSARVLDRAQLKAPNEKVKLTPDAGEAAVVLWAFRIYAEGGESLGSLAERLKVRAPGRRWSRTVVTAMLQNPAYHGDVVGGRRRDGDSTRYGCEAAHEAIVSPKLFQAVQARLGRNHRLGAAARSHYLLSGLMTCPHCLQAYTGGGVTSSATDPEKRHFYRDNGGISGACPGRIGTVMRHLVDAAAVDVVGSTLQSPAVQRRIVRAVDDALDAVSGSPGTSEAALRAAVARWEQRRDRLVAALADGTVLPAEASAQLERTRAALAEMDEQLQALRFRNQRARGVRSERDRILSLAFDFPAVAARLSGPRLRELVEPWLASVTFDKVSRMLGIGIRPIPAVPSLVLAYSPGPVGRDEVGLILRRTSLLQPGHEYRVAEAEDEMRRARRRA